jgi:riboflavin kinase/FMN adenylyltransferase
MKDLGKNAVIVPSVTFDGDVVSSSKICTLLMDGNVEDVCKMGVLFGFESKVIHGAHLGNKLGFPTINQIVPDELIHPKYGVYSVLATVDGKEYMGVTNFGVKPTVSDENIPVAETFIIDFSGDIYDKLVSLRFVKRLRDEKQFSSLDELKKNISDNVEQTRKYFEEYYEKH